MFDVKKIHDRFESVNGEWYWDGEPITDVEAMHLRLHYESVCAKLKQPWENKDDVLEWGEGDDRRIPHCEYRRRGNAQGVVYARQPIQVQDIM